MGTLPISNATYSQSAVITRLASEEDEGPRTPEWARRANATPEVGYDITAMATTVDGAQVLVALGDGSVRRLDTRTLGPIGPQMNHGSELVDHLVVRPDGSVVTADRAGTIRVFAAGSADPIAGPLDQITDPAVGVQPGPDDTVIAGPVDGHLVVLDPTDGRVVRRLMSAAPGEFTVLATWTGGTAIRLLGGGSDGTLTYWDDTRDGGLPLQASERHDGPVQIATFAPDGTRAATLGGFNGFQWRTQDMQVTQRMQMVPDEGVASLSFDDTSTRLLAAATDQWARIWVDGRVAEEFRTAGALRAGQFLPGGSGILLAENSGSVVRWGDISGEITSQLSLPTPQTTRDEARPAIGVLLTHEHSWTMEGIALGELLHGTSLAPGEITQLAVTSHTQRLLQHSASTVAADDTTVGTTTSASALSEDEAAAAHEVSAGGSTSSSASATSQVGASGLFVSSSGSVSAALSMSVSHASGTREIAEERNQSVHQQTAQRARSARSRHAAAVREVGEAESMELKTRVVANYNHMHALNLQFYEVVEVQRLTTKVVEAHRLIFVPVRVMSFDVPDHGEDPLMGLLASHPQELQAVLADLGHTGAAASLEYLGPLSDDLRHQRLAGMRLRPRRLSEQLADARTVLGGLQADALDKRNLALKAQDALRNADDPGLAEQDRLQQVLATARQEAQEAADRATAKAKTVSDLVKALAHARRQAREVIGFIEDAGLDLHPTIPGPEIDTAVQTGVIDRPEDAFPALEQEGLQQLRDRLRQLLVDNQLAVNHGLWLRLDRSVWAGVLQGSTFEGRPLGPDVDPTPVAVSGNLVAFRWHHADSEEAERFHHQHVTIPAEYAESVTVPTGGVFGEAVLGESNSADKIDITRYWSWVDSLPPLRPTEIGALKQPTPTTPQAPTTDETSSRTIDLGPISFPEVASSTPEISKMLANPELFRDLSGGSTSAALAKSAMAASRAGATKAAEIAGDNFRRYLAFQQAIAKSAMKAFGDPSAADFDPTMAGAALISGAADRPLEERAATNGSDRTPEEVDGSSTPPEGTGEGGEGEETSAGGEGGGNAGPAPDTDRAGEGDGLTVSFTRLPGDDPPTAADEDKVVALDDDEVDTTP